VVVRTERGREFVRDAITHGHVLLERVSHDLLPRSQPNLLKTRGAVWGRMVALRLTLQPAPTYRNMPTFGFWMRELSLVEKLRSLVGTAKRVATRRLFRRRPVVPVDESELAPRKE
jgi:coenzyme F420 hydrogenase subunit beta